MTRPDSVWKDRWRGVKVTVEVEPHPCVVVQARGYPANRTLYRATPFVSSRRLRRLIRQAEKWIVYQNNLEYLAALKVREARSKWL